MYFQIQREPASRLKENIGRNAKVPDIVMYQFHVLRIVVVCRGPSCNTFYAMTVNIKVTIVVQQQASDLYSPKGRVVRLWLAKIRRRSEENSCSYLSATKSDSAVLLLMSTLIWDLLGF